MRRYGFMIAALVIATVGVTVGIAAGYRLGSVWSDEEDIAPSSASGRPTATPVPPEIAAERTRVAGLPTPTQTALPPTPIAPSIVCDEGELELEHRRLGFAACFPPGWQLADGSASLDDIQDRLAVQLASAEAFDERSQASERAIRMMVGFFPLDGSFGECTPSIPSPFDTFERFCEDVYDITPMGEAVLSPAGARVGWKLLQPARREILGVQQDGFLFVNVNFAATERAYAEPIIREILESFVILERN
jgi:hypothetical protein